jgi:DNA-binding protein YbaB
MTYKELQNQLKTFKSQGLTTIALNAKKDILEVEYNRVMNKLVKDAINSEYEDCEAVTISNDTDNLVKEVSALEIASEDLVNEIVVNPPLKLIEDCSLNSLPLESKINLVIETIEAIPSEIKKAVITLIPSEIIGVSIDDYTVKSNDKEAFEDLSEGKEDKNIGVYINDYTLSNSESMAKDTEVTSKEFFEALVKLFVIFVSSIVKLWLKVNRISLLSEVILGKVKEARADIKGYWQWFIKGFNPPSFV